MPIDLTPLNDGITNHVIDQISADRTSAEYIDTQPEDNRQLTVNVKQSLQRNRATGKETRRANIQFVLQTIPSTADNDVPSEEVILNLGFTAPKLMTTITPAQREKLVNMFASAISPDNIMKLHRGDV